MSESATIRSIHLTAICGVGMAPLAVALKRAGYRVTGSDKQAFPPMSRVLADAGIPIREGFAKENLEPRPDLVIVGNAVTATNVEAVEIEKLGIPRMSFPEAVGRFLIGDSKSLVVAGTHGKTTTTGMLAVALEGAGVEPGNLVGGLMPDLGELGRAGAGTYFAIEGDGFFARLQRNMFTALAGVVAQQLRFHVHETAEQALQAVAADRQLDAAALLAEARARGLMGTG